MSYNITKSKNHKIILYIASNLFASRGGFMVGVGDVAT